jgi:hypothetical protein
MLSSGSGAINTCRLAVTSRFATCGSVSARDQTAESASHAVRVSTRISRRAQASALITVNGPIASATKEQLRATGGTRSATLHHLQRREVGTLAAAGRDRTFLSYGLPRRRQSELAPEVEPHQLKTVAVYLIDMFQ